MRYMNQSLLLLLALLAELANAAPIALENATFIDVREGVAKPGYTLLIDQERIAAAGPSGTISIPDNAIRQNLQGRFLLPGFIDTHVHSVWGRIKVETIEGNPVMQLDIEPEISRRMIEPLPRFGITSMRNPGAHAQTAVAQRAAIAKGEIDAPRLFSAGDVIDLAGAPGLVVGATTPEAMRAEVARQAELGVDFIKLYASLDSTLLKVGVDAAHEHGLPAIGHLLATDWGSAAELGIDDIVHAMPSSPAMLPAESRQKYLGGITGSQFLYQWFEYVDFDAPEMQSVVDSMARNSVRHDPTLVAVEGLFFGNKPEVVSHPRMDLVPDAVREDWSGTAGVNAAWSEEDFHRAQAVWPRVLELVARLHAAGVELTAGTDLVNPNVIPGVSFHRELELMSDAGIPAVDILRIATLNGARALGRESELGTLEVGKLADIVVLAANPLDDIHNTQRIEAVYMAGRKISIDQEEN